MLSCLQKHYEEIISRSKVCDLRMNISEKKVYIFMGQKKPRRRDKIFL
jgi:hypothetical protein